MNILFSYKPTKPTLYIAAAVTALMASAGLLATSAQSIHAAAGSKKIISETFNYSSANFTTKAGGSWNIGGGKYSLTNPAIPSSVSVANANYSIHKKSVSGNFTQSVDITVTPTSSNFDDASVLFGVVDASNYYYASFNETADNYTNGIFKVTSGSQTRLTGFSSTFTAGDKRRMSIEKAGDKLSVLVNGAVVGSAISSSFPQNSRVGVGSRNDAVTFDYMTVYSDPSIPATPAPLPPIPAPPRQTKLIDSNFDSLPSGQVSRTTFREAMNDPNVNTWGLDHTSIVDSAGHDKVIRQTIPANKIGGASGATLTPKLLKDVSEASIQYDIRFDNNFDFSRSGKLPGLGGAKAGIAANTATGCQSADAKVWSGRGMWMKPSSKRASIGETEWIGYMYNFNKKETCGDYVYTDATFKKGTWHTIKQTYKMNTTSGGKANADGVHKMYIDGKLVSHSTNYKYRTDNDLKVNHVYWSVFRGGSDMSWSSPKTNYIDIDNLVVSTP